MAPGAQDCAAGGGGGIPPGFEAPASAPSVGVAGAKTWAVLKPG